MSEARIDKISNENSTAGPIISGITTFSGQNYFVPPKGTTAERPSYCSPGSIRFNTDSAKLEYFDSLQWLEMEAFNNEVGISTNAAGTSGGLGNRGVFGGGYAPGDVNTIDYVTISTLGNAQDFGDLTVKRRPGCGFASRSRGVFCAGRQIGLIPSNVIDYITISSTGNAVDFGDTYQVQQSGFGFSSETRGVYGAGETTSDVSTNVIQYITIASTGNGVDFGDINTLTANSKGCSSTTRGVFAGGATPGSPVSTYLNIIEYVTISTLGNSIDFGDLTQARLGSGAVSNATRGIFGAGFIPAGRVNTIDFITITSLGNAQDFGDTPQTIFASSGGCSSPTRGIFAGGYTPGGANIINYVSILTTGNAVDFGDLFQSRGYPAGLSNGHGGL